MNECNCDVCTNSVDFDGPIDYCGELCEHCGKKQDDCYCEFCDYCNEHIDDCECHYCDECDQHERDCNCEEEEEGVNSPFNKRRSIMTEEQVKKIIVDMIANGELKVKLKKEKLMFNSAISYLRFSIEHSNNGYTKELFSQEIRL